MNSQPITRSYAKAGPMIMICSQLLIRFNYDTTSTTVVLCSATAPPAPAGTAEISRYSVCCESTPLHILHYLQGVSRGMVSSLLPKQTCENSQYCSTSTMIFSCDLQRVFDYNGSQKDIWINCELVTTVQLLHSSISSTTQFVQSYETSVVWARTASKVVP